MGPKGKIWVAQALLARPRRVHSVWRACASEHLSLRKGKFEVEGLACDRRFAIGPSAYSEFFHAGRDAAAEYSEKREGNDDESRRVAQTGVERPSDRARQGCIQHAFAAERQ